MTRILRTMPGAANAPSIAFKQHVSNFPTRIEWRRQHFEPELFDALQSRRHEGADGCWDGDKYQAGTSWLFILGAFLAAVVAVSVGWSLWLSPLWERMQ